MPSCCALEAPERWPAAPAGRAGIGLPEIHVRRLPGASERKPSMAVTALTPGIGHSQATPARADCQVRDRDLLPSVIGGFLINLFVNDYKS
jgi:hypothetical protein